MTVAVNKGLELLRDPERGGVAAVGVVFSSLGTDFRISEFCRGVIVTKKIEKLTQIVFSGGKLWSHWQTRSVC